MRNHGPLWVNGDHHIVVIAGIKGDDVKVYDPWPPKTGRIEWRSLPNWLFRETRWRIHDSAGDTLTSIGKRHGVDWKTIYNHARNAAFRRKRPDANKIRPGDKVHIPTSASDMDTRAALAFLYLPMKACAR